MTDETNRPKRGPGATDRPTTGSGGIADWIELFAELGQIIIDCARRLADWSRKYEAKRGRPLGGLA
ncbi:hypothetical protein ACFVXQ_17670 [Kitasatospora sp. NPDC058263]